MVATVCGFTCQASGRGHIGFYAQKLSISLEPPSNTANSLSFCVSIAFRPTRAGFYLPRVTAQIADEYRKKGQDDSTFASDLVPSRILCTKNNTPDLITITFGRLAHTVAHSHTGICFEHHAFWPNRNDFRFQEDHKWHFNRRKD